MKKNKILYIIVAIIILAGIAVTATMQLKFSLEYEQSKRLEIYLGKDFEIADMKQIAEEVFPNQEMKIQKVEVFGDMVGITVKDASEEQKDSLLQKVNEKYTLEVKKEDVNTVEIPHMRGRDLVQRYLVPLAIATLLVAIFLIVRYHKLGGIKIMVKVIGKIALVEAVYLSLIAITRLPITPYTIPLGIAIATISTIIILNQYEDRLKEKIEKESKQEETE